MAACSHALLMRTLRHLVGAHAELYAEARALLQEEPPPSARKARGRLEEEEDDDNDDDDEDDADAETRDEVAAMASPPED